MVRRRERPALVGAGLVLLLAACASGTSSTSSSGPTVTSQASPPPPLHLVVTQPHWRLPAPVSRAVALADGTNLVVAGGLDSHDGSSPAVTTFDPSNGHVLSSARLRWPVHDAAGGAVGTHLFVFGGGSTTSTGYIQELRPHGTAVVAGTLPRVRSDLSSATVSGTTYLVGGYDGSTPDRSVLATTDGVSFTTVATLPQGVRYAAVIATPRALWVLGGEQNGVPVDIVQRVALPSGTSRVVGHLPRPLSHATAVDLSGQLLLAGGRTTGDGLMSTVLRFRPGTMSFRTVGQLPMGTSDMGAAVVGDHAYLVGGETPGVTDTVTTLSLEPKPTTTDSSASTGATEPSWLRPPTGPSFLAPGSDPSVLPGPVLIADKLNNRLIVVDPQGRVRWVFPRKGDLAPGQTFQIPDDAFFSPDGKQIIATEEDDFVVSVIDIATHRIVYRYGTPGVPGSTANHLNNPDDALLMPNGEIVTPDIKNCRILRIAPGTHHPSHIYGTTGSCYHGPPSHFGSPNGAFPLRNGNLLVTEIQGSWVDELTPDGRVLWSVHVPGVFYPSDTNEISPGRYLTVDYSTPGQVVEFGRDGHTIWRWSPTGGQMLRQPSLARPLPNGDVILNDDANHRVIVVDPRTDRIVWQYGHTGTAGSAPGYLDNPDGLDFLPPYNLMSGR